MEKRTVGQTKDAGWQFGIRKSIPLSVTEVWDFLFSTNGEKLWLNGADKEFSTLKNLSHVRTKWKLKDWANDAILQMRVISSKEKTTIAFHIEKLINEKQREETKIHWEKVMKIIIDKITMNR